MFIPVYLLIILGFLAAVGGLSVLFFLVSFLVVWLDPDFRQPPWKPERMRQ